MGKVGNWCHTGSTYIFSEGFNTTWETLAICHKTFSNWITLPFHPTVIDDDIFVASVFVALRNQNISCFFKQSFAIEWGFMTKIDIFRKISHKSLAWGAETAPQNKFCIFSVYQKKCWRKSTFFVFQRVSKDDTDAVGEKTNWNANKFKENSMFPWEDLRSSPFALHFWLKTSISHCKSPICCIQFEIVRSKFIRKNTQNTQNTHLIHSSG